MCGGIIAHLIHTHSMVLNEALGKALGLVSCGLISSLWNIHARTRTHHTHTTHTETNIFLTLMQPHEISAILETVND
jgi:hypothetical protein